MTFTYANENPSTTMDTRYAAVSAPVGLKTEPTFSTASTSRRDETTSSNHCFMLSGITPFVFSAADPPTLPSGLLIVANIAANTATTAVDPPTAKAVFSGLGTQTLWTAPGEDDALGVEVASGLEEGLGLDVELAVEVAEAVELGEPDEVRLDEVEVMEESGITVKVPPERLVTSSSPLAVS